jgi:hypothetical protein
MNGHQWCAEPWIAAMPNALRRINLKNAHAVAQPLPHNHWHWQTTPSLFLGCFLNFTLVSNSDLMIRTPTCLASTVQLKNDYLRQPHVGIHPDHRVEHVDTLS